VVEISFWTVIWNRHYHVL